MKTITIHKNLHTKKWSVGSPVIACSAVLATGVSLPDMRNSRNKQFLNCLNGGSRKVFAKARAVNAYGFDDGGEPSVYWEGGDTFIQFAEDIINDIRLSIAACDNWHIFSQLQHHDLAAVRVRFDPTIGDTYFWAEDRPEEALIYADIMLFAPNGNAYILRGVQ